MQATGMVPKRRHAATGLRRLVVGPWAIAIIAVTAMALISYGFARPDTGNAADTRIIYQYENDILTINDESLGTRTIIDRAGIKGWQDRQITLTELDDEMEAFAATIKRNTGWSLPEDLGKMQSEANEARILFDKVQPRTDSERQIKEVLQAFVDTPEAECRGRCLFPPLPPGSGAKFTKIVLFGSAVVVTNLLNAVFEVRPVPAAAALLGTALIVGFATWAWETYDGMQQGRDIESGTQNQEAALRAHSAVSDAASTAAGLSRLGVEATGEGLQLGTLSHRYILDLMIVSDPGTPDSQREQEADERDMVRDEL